MRIQNEDILNSINVKNQRCNGSLFIDSLNQLKEYFKAAYDSRDYKSIVQFYKLILLKEEETRDYRDNSDNYEQICKIHREMDDILGFKFQDVIKQGYQSINDTGVLPLKLSDDYMITENNNKLYIEIESSDKLISLLDIPDKEAFNYKFYICYYIEFDSIDMQAIVKNKEPIEEDIYSKVGFIPVMLGENQYQSLYSPLYAYIEEKLDSIDYDYVMSKIGDLDYE